MKTFENSQAQTTLFDAVLNAAKEYGRGKQIIEDHERRPMTYNGLLLASLVIGRKLNAILGPRKRVGVFLPTAVGSAVVFLGLNAFGKVPAMLNFTAGARNLVSSCETADVDTIITSRRFVENGRLDDVIAALGEGRRIIWMEDLRPQITVFDKIRGVLDKLFARRVHARFRSKPDDEAVVLFTSGSEGMPKGVVLSNFNLLVNVIQVRRSVGDLLTPTDITFNTLPIFHAFGLMGGLLFGLTGGMKVVLYPSPLHYKQIPKLISDTHATLVFSTDTFLQGYARAAGGVDMSSVRFVIAGAERVRAETRKSWDQYHTTILEGYGATECSPVIAVNLPHKQLHGTVGTFTPDLEWRTEHVEGIHEGGRLFVRGPNIMKGYIDPTDPYKLLPLEDGWHDTGDIVTIDEQGFVTIKGRAKRFAKIGGEMVSLAAVEALAQGLWPENNHAAVALPDARKGEQIILITTCAEAGRDDLLAFAKAEQFPELWLPKALLNVDAIPIMGVGKTDYTAATEMAERMRAML